MQRMGKKAGAIGFAVYLGLLEGLNTTRNETDIDVLLLYDASTPLLQVVEEVQAQIQAGKSVRAQKTSDGVRYQTLVDLRGGKV